MKKVLLILLIVNINLFGQDWTKAFGAIKEDAAKYGKKEAADSLGVDISVLSDAENIYDAIVSKNGNILIEGFGSMLGGYDLLQDSFGGALSYCYVRDNNLKRVNTDIDLCKYVNLPNIGTDFCSGLPNIPGYKKIDNKIGSEMLGNTEKRLKEFCKSVFGGDIKDSQTVSRPLGDKISKSRASDENEMDKTITDENIKKEVYQKEEINPEKIAKMEDGLEKDPNGNLVKVTPLKKIADQNEKKSREAYKHYLLLAEKKEKLSAESTIKTAAHYAKEINVEYETIDDYLEDRKKIVNKIFTEEEYLIDLNPKLETAKYDFKKVEDLDVSMYPEKERKKIKNDTKNSYKANYLTDYQKHLDAWIAAKTKYYHMYKKDGFPSPTRGMVDHLTSNSNTPAIDRASLVYRINKQIHSEAWDISSIYKKALELKLRFSNELDKEIILSSEFDRDQAYKDIMTLLGN